MTEQTLEQATAYIGFLNERIEQREKDRTALGHLADELIGGYRCVRESVYQKFPQLRPAI